MTHVKIVGMQHHYGEKQLPIETGYSLKAEPRNQWGDRAVRVVDRETQDVVAYVARGFTPILKIWAEGLAANDVIYLKTISPGKTCNHKMVQHCSIGFLVNTRFDRDDVCKKIDGYGLKLRFV